MSNAVLEINKQAIIHNLDYFKNKVSEKTKILIVVKAFAYGSESVFVAKILEDQEVDYLAVAYVDEGITLRNAGVKIPILVLHPQIKNLQKIIDYQLELNLYGHFILDEFLKIAKENNLISYPIHLKFNTGLNRLGFHFNETTTVIDKIKNTNTVKLTSVFSHLAASEDASEKEFTKNQIRSFTNIKNKINKLLNQRPIYHLLNTSGIINYSHAQFDMVRLGIGLYGFANDKKYTKQLKNVLTLKSVISQIHTIKKGESIGYNRAFLATKTTKTATVSIGHADGISRQLGNEVGFVYINNKKAAIIGNVCMDMIMVDVTHINCKVNDEIIIFNSQDSIALLAKKTNTIEYEILTQISQRVKRVIR